MSLKTSTHTIEEQLLHSRKEGLKDALEINSMCAHGKVLGMDTFSWINPQIDSLTSALSSFPFDIIWLGSHSHIQDCLKIQPDLSRSIRTIIVHDNSELDFNPQRMNEIQNVVCLNGINSSLELIKTMKKEKCVLFFSTTGENAQSDKKEFENFISLF